MTPFVNALACLLCLASAMFLWRYKSSFYRNSLLLVGFMIIFGVFTFFGGEMFEAGSMPMLEHYPFKMLALSLCFSTTSLAVRRRRYMVLAQVFWLWIELFGGISLFYRGFDIAWTRIIAIAGIAFFSSLLSKISKEMEFCLMVFWIAVWIFF